MNLLSDIAVFTKYARYLEDKKRRENWEELVSRSVEMHCKKYPHISEMIRELADKYIYPKKILPSMRSLQFGGAAVDRSPNRIYNCAYLPVEHYKAFSEAMFLLLGGTGLGFSVQYLHIAKLGIVHGPKESTRRFLIDDSIEGWADAVKVLVSSYFNNERKVLFDFSQIREKGMPLITSGGKAPGPEPLRRCLANLDVELSSAVGRNLKPIEAYSLMCHIADAVLAGGIRRAALSCLFSPEDNEMMTAKVGDWAELNPHFGRANNSAVLLRGEDCYEDFKRVFDTVRYGGSGEPGVYWTNDRDIGTNPWMNAA